MYAVFIDPDSRGKSIDTFLHLLVLEEQVLVLTRDGKFSILRYLKPRFATKVCTGLGLVYLILTDTTTNFRPKPRFQIPQNTKFAIPS